jgi:hypothetical protein
MVEINLPVLSGGIGDILRKYHREGVTFSSVPQKHQAAYRSYLENIIVGYAEDDDMDKYYDSEEAVLLDT